MFVVNFKIQIYVCTLKMHEHMLCCFGGGSVIGKYFCIILLQPNPFKPKKLKRDSKKKSHIFLFSCIHS